MDETTRVIIESSITVLGMIAAFLAAFFAEPVKVHFQSKNKLNDIRHALYKELWINYFICVSVINSNDPDIEIRLESIQMVVDDTIRMEFYNQILKNDPVSFYRLREAIVIDFLYSTLMLLPRASKFKPTKEAYNKQDFIDLIQGTAKGFCEDFAMSVYSKGLDEELLRPMIRKNDFEQLLKHGRLLSSTKDMSHIRPLISLRKFLVK